MDIAIRYLTTFTYDTHVNESHNALRACPATTPTQELVRYNVTVDPETRVASHRDYWGTHVDTFGVVGGHTRLTLVADADVRTSQPAQPENDSPWPPGGVPTDGLYEYLVPSPHVAWDEPVAAFGSDATANASALVEAAIDVQQAIAGLLTYTPGVTEVGTSVAQIWEQQSGVCQDYAHVAIAVYRSLGMPARYVSGYLYAADSATGEQPETDGEIVVATHAWVEVYVPGFGWWGLDPTNQLAVGERHVKIGHGRDYEDVTPLRGVYHGEAESGGLEASVTMSRTHLDRYQMLPQPPRQDRQDEQQQQQQQQ